MYGLNAEQVAADARDDADFMCCPHDSMEPLIDMNDKITLRCRLCAEEIADE